MSRLQVQQFPKNMGELPVNKTNPNRCLVSGLFEEWVRVGDTSRRFLTYLPEGLENNQRCIVLAPPACAEPLEYLESSGFQALADEQKLFLHLLLPQGSAWNYDGSDADYMNAVYVQIQARDYYVTMQDNIYAFGVEDGATVAQQAGRKMSGEWSGLATFGDLDADVMRSGNGSVSGPSAARDGELALQEVKSQLPVWMVWDSDNEINRAALAYWRELNHCVDSPLSGQGADEIYLPDGVWKRSSINEEQISQVRVTRNASSQRIPEDLLTAVWEYIGSARRHRGFRQKFLRSYKDPIRYGAMRHTMEVDGYTRVWYEYVPDRVKALDKPVPVVVCMHGRGGTAETFFDISGMSCVAEERDFIAVFPQAGIYQQKPGGIRNILLWQGAYRDEPIDDVKFIRLMLENIHSRWAVDRGRIYACGQSSGGMMTATLGEAASELFAAVAPWSGLRDPSGPDTQTPPQIAPSVPFLFLYGEQDFIIAEPKNEAFPARVQDYVGNYLRNIIELYGLDPEPYSYRCGETTYYIFANKKGTPMLTVGQVDGMPHANYPFQSWITYDQHFARYSRTDDGTLLYMGKSAE